MGGHRKQKTDRDTLKKIEQDKDNDQKMKKK
jgi:hypothetical protein